MRIIATGSKIGLFVLLACGTGIDGNKAGLIYFPSPFWARLRTPSGIKLREQPGINGERILLLRNYTLVRILAQTGESYSAGSDGTGPWYLIRTRSGHEGYGFSKFFTRVPADVAERETAIDRANFESQLSDSLRGAIGDYITGSGRFPGYNLREVQLVSPLKPTGSKAYRVHAVGYLVGFWEINKKSVQASAVLFLDLDQNQPGASTWHIQSIETGEEKMIEGITPSEGVGLLSRLL